MTDPDRPWITLPDPEPAPPLWDRPRLMLGAALFAAVLIVLALAALMGGF